MADTASARLRRAVSRVQYPPEDCRPWDGAMSPSLTGGYSAPWATGEAAALPKTSWDEDEDDDDSA